MPNKRLVLAKFILGNFIPTLQVLGLIIFLTKSEVFATQTLIWVLIWIYLVPPVVVRLVYFFCGRPNGTYSVRDREFWVWYIGAQFQALYLRIPFLEELLRLFPLVYSNWLRLWGAKIGRATFWGPQVLIMDRTHLEIGDDVLVGHGTGFTSHHVNRVNEQFELVIASPRVADRVIMGGLSGLGPGAAVEADEMLPSTMLLAPFYVWKNGRRQSKLTREE